MIYIKFMLKIFKSFRDFMLENTLLLLQVIFTLERLLNILLNRNLNQIILYFYLELRFLVKENGVYWEDVHKGSMKVVIMI